MKQSVFVASVLSLGWQGVAHGDILTSTLGTSEQSPMLNGESWLPQVLSQPYEDVSSGKTFRLPLRSSDYAFSTTVALGTPPQPFHAAVDLAETRSMGLSVECADWTCDPDYHWVYNSSKSSTFVPDGTKSTLNYYDGEYEGHISQDTLHLLGLQIENQTFHEATSLLPTGFDYLWDEYDGLLGLSPPGSKDELKEVTPVLTNLVAQGKLKSNVISLRVPDWGLLEENGGGELLIGGIDHSHYKGDITYLPLTDESSDPILGKTWTTDATSVRFTNKDDKDDLINEPLDDYLAVINIGNPSIALPGYLIAELVTLSGAEELPGYEGQFWEVDCGSVESLPTFTVSLSGREFTLTPQQYTREVEYFFGEISCLMAFSPIEYYFASSNSQGSKDKVFPKKPTIILGSWFLRYYYTILDMDKARVGFAEAKPLKE